MDATTRAKRTVFDCAAAMGYTRAAIVAAAMAALTAGSLLATGSEAAAAQACRAKLDSLGGYQRIHAWCQGTYVKVLVECRKGTAHASSYYRWGYNKAECHVGREGGIVSRDVYTCSRPSGSLCRG
jgi:hypothetical protein